MNDWNAFGDVGAEEKPMAHNEVHICDDIIEIFGRSVKCRSTHGPSEARKRMHSAMVNTDDGMKTVEMNWL